MSGLGGPGESPVGGALPPSLATTAPAAVTDAPPTSERSYYRCRTCRTRLISGRAVVGVAAAEATILPATWMADALAGGPVAAAKGRLRCPGCDSKVGGWDWTPPIPSFTLTLRSVDIVRH